VQTTAAPSPVPMAPAKPLIRGMENFNGNKSDEADFGISL
jgi:hypothetical protein